ncbi:hypothetical protein [Laribacter hongkongensis]|nr:hypothetical protein [Laribacter hongkongensis]MCG8996542.1 hypothetical protein [Laribacter hongkongensis]MCG9047704.1 hypothetical protein [Laribacter hongkongensis]
MPENKNHNQLIYMKFNTHHQPHHGEIPHVHAAGVGDIPHTDPAITAAVQQDSSRTGILLTGKNSSQPLPTPVFIHKMRDSSQRRDG